MFTNLHDLVEALPKLLPLASAWLQDQERLILTQGRPLSASEQADAKTVGVTKPENIRVLIVPVIPSPDNPMLAEAAKVAQLITPYTIGLTLRYGIYIRSDYSTDRALYVHEFVHVGQYERMGIMGFLTAYLAECATPPGYPHGPLEQEAVRKAAETVPQ